MGKTADVIPSGTPCRMAVMTWCLAIEKTCPTNIYAAFSPRSGGAVTMVSCYWQGSYPEPTQWGCGGGRVEALLSGGGLRSGEAEANILCEGLGGETTARVTTIYRHRWSCGRKDEGFSCYSGKCRQELRALLCSIFRSALRSRG